MEGGGRCYRCGVCVVSNKTRLSISRSGPCWGQRLATYMMDVPGITLASLTFMGPRGDGTHETGTRVCKMSSDEGCRADCLEGGCRTGSYGRVRLSSTLTCSDTAKG